MMMFAKNALHRGFVSLWLYGGQFMDASKFIEIKLLGKLTRIDSRLNHLEADIENLKSRFDNLDAKTNQ